MALPSKVITIKILTATFEKNGQDDPKIHIEIHKTPPKVRIYIYLEN